MPSRYREFHPKHHWSYENMPSRFQPFHPEHHWSYENMPSRFQPFHPEHHSSSNMNCSIQNNNQPGCEFIEIENDDRRNYSIDNLNPAEQQWHFSYVPQQNGLIILNMAWGQY
jgi:hypothetical protein